MFNLCLEKGTVYELLARMQFKKSKDNNTQQGCIIKEIRNIIILLNYVNFIF